MAQVVPNSANVLPGLSRRKPTCATVAAHLLFINICGMNDRQKLITEQALSLPASERGRLCEALLISLQGAGEQDEAEFKEEIRHRREAFRAGEMTARPFGDILRERLAK